ncbi:MAG: carboxylesterase family protein [Proteobacteria bacterium]|nr:carboxylesterase family protein [Pseudomonadota bacterium]
MKKDAILFLIALIIFSTSAFSSCDRCALPETLRTTIYGDVIGFNDKENSHAWLGIPYAKPPVGDLRWKASVPPENWSGTKKALELCSECTQVGDAFASTATIFEANKAILGSEDCLYLNIWAPRFDADHIPSGNDRLPVMFWIHGGGNRAGYGGINKGYKLAASQNVIVVMINYRLTSFGYFSHPAFRNETAKTFDNTANYGTTDMILALNWVKDNISSFGGNPENVTIFGESAGGRNVMSLVLSKEADGLFHRAIMQSGGIDTYTIEEAENYMDDPSPGNDYSSREVLCNLLVTDGLATDRDDAKRVQNSMSNEEIADYLRAKTKEEILGAYKDANGKYIWPPTIVQDGYLVPEMSVEDILKDTTNYNNVPVIMGTTRDESKLFMFMEPKFTSWFQLISGVTEDYYNSYAMWDSNIKKLGAVDDPARWFLSDPDKSDVYAFRFDWDEEGALFGFVDLSLLLGAAHGVELSFIFGDFKTYHLSPFLYNSANVGFNSATRDLLSDQMMSYWAQFAYTGNPGTGKPGSKEMVEWKAWDDTSPGAGKFVVFDTPQDGGIYMSSEEVTTESIRDGIMADELLTSEDKCELLKKLFQASPDYAEEMYPDNNGDLCEFFPY